MDSLDPGITDRLASFSTTPNLISLWSSPIFLLYVKSLFVPLSTNPYLRLRFFTFSTKLKITRKGTNTHSILLYSTFLLNLCTTYITLLFLLLCKVNPTQLELQRHTIGEIPFDTLRVLFPYLPFLNKPWRVIIHSQLRYPNSP